MLPYSPHYWSCLSEYYLSLQIHIRPCTVCSLDRWGHPGCWRDPEVNGVQRNGERWKTKVSLLSGFILDWIICSSYVYLTCNYTFSVTQALSTNLSPTPDPTWAITIQRASRKIAIMCNSLSAGNLCLLRRVLLCFRMQHALWEVYFSICPKYAFNNT